MPLEACKRKETSFSAGKGTSCISMVETREKVKRVYRKSCVASLVTKKTPSFVQTDHVDTSREIIN